MNVLLTCACGRSQQVPIALAGTTTPCAGCGRPLAVPALGVAVERPRRAAPAHPPAASSAFAFTAPPRAAPQRRVSSGGMTAIALIGCGVLLLVLGGGVGIWSLGLHEHLHAPTFVAQADPTPAPLAADPTQGVPVPAAPTPRAVSAEPAPPEAGPPVNLQPPEPPAIVAKPVEPAEPIVAKPAEPVVKPVVVKPVEPVVAKPALPFKEGDTFLQDLVVTQKSRFAVQGIPVATLLQYRVVSRYTVEQAQPNGSLVVRQKVESAALLQADELTQGLLAGPVERLPGTMFILNVGPNGAVTKLAGAGDALQFGAAKLPGGLGVQMASLMDADGWKELAQATFFQPEQRDKPGRWSHPLVHRWGPLGGWAGVVTYAYPGPEKGPEVKVGYLLKLAYQPPQGPGAVGALPLTVVGANFQPPQAGGTIVFDTQRGKTVAVEERFHVRGRLTLMLLGQNAPAEIEEEQHFQMRIVEKKD